MPQSCAAQTAAHLKIGLRELLFTGKTEELMTDTDLIVFGH